jgi:PAS domain S-box-containing protein
MDDPQSQPESLNAMEPRAQRNGSGQPVGPAAGDLQQREAELRDFVEQAGVALHWVAEDGTILWANAEEMDFLGYTPREYIGHNIQEFHVDQPVIADILIRLKNNEKLKGCRARLRCRDGSIRYVSISSSVYRQNGRFIHTRCVTLDVTEQERNSEYKARLAAIVESSDDAIISKDLNGMILSWNGGAERIFGYQAEEVVGKHISVIAPEDRLDEIAAILGRISRGERVDHFQTRRKTKDGRTLDISLTVSPIRDAEGTIIGASKVARDITGQQRLSELQELLAAIVESSDDAIISKDLEGNIRSWNRGAEQLFGYTAAEILGKHISTLAAPERIDEIPDILDRIKRGERVDHFETKRRTKGGRILTVSLTVSPIRDSSGVVIGASKVARDITEREVQERALREANDALSRSNADLQQFAYSASHDLQEPLRMVATYSEMLKREFGDKLGPDGVEYIGYTLQGALRMDRLLKDLRAYTLATTSSQEAVGDVDAGEILDKALADLGAAIMDSGATITRTSMPQVRLHEFQLEQIFQNLVGNAIRYRGSAPPQILVSAIRQGQEWLFSVQDNGIGIDSQYKEQVFDLFKRLHSAAQYPGTGMGLAICKRIVERAKGRIWVDSDPGRGSTFFFTLPRTET